MAATILQVNFRWDLPAEEQEQHVTPESAREVSEFPGLNWKVWLKNDETKVSGGIYSFRDEQSARAWGDGALREVLAGLPGVSDVSVSYFGVHEEASVVTRAPLPELTARVP